MWKTLRQIAIAPASRPSRRRRPTTRCASRRAPAGATFCACSAARCASATSTPARATAASSRSTRSTTRIYNLEGLGIRFVASPRHADMLLVTGPVSRNMEVALRAHLRRDARSEARRRGRRLRLHRRHLRRELRELRARVERHSGRRRRAGLPAEPESDSRRHSHCYIGASASPTAGGSRVR